MVGGGGRWWEVAIGLCGIDGYGNRLSIVVIG